MRDIKVYPIIRETHLQVENDEVREACERLVQVLMRDEEGEEKVDGGMTALSRKPQKAFPKSPAGGGVGRWAKHDEPSDDESDDDKIVEV